MPCSLGSPRSPTSKYDMKHIPKSSYSSTCEIPRYSAETRLCPWFEAASIASSRITPPSKAWGTLSLVLGIKISEISVLMMVMVMTMVILVMMTRGIMTIVIIHDHDHLGES